MDNDAFTNMVSELLLTAEGGFHLVGNANVVAVTQVGEIAISRIPFSQFIRLSGINVISSH